MTFVGMVWNAPKWATGKEDPNNYRVGCRIVQPLNPADYGDFLSLANRYPKTGLGTVPRRPELWSSSGVRETKAYGIRQPGERRHPQAKTKTRQGNMFSFLSVSDLSIWRREQADRSSYLYSVAGFAGKYDALTAAPAYVQPPTRIRSRGTIVKDLTG